MSDTPETDNTQIDPTKTETTETETTEIGTVRTVQAVVATLPPRVAKLLAAEILLANPESLQDDVLESCLYIFRERLTAAGAGEAAQ